MPKTPKAWLTKEQRKERERQEHEKQVQKTYQRFSDDLATYMRHSNMTQRQLASELGIACSSAAKLLHAQRVQIDVFILFETLRMLGFKVIKPDT